MDQELCDSFAVLLSYAENGYREELVDLVTTVKNLHPDVAEVKKWEDVCCELEIFLRETQSLTTEDYQELYTRTFDINPVSSLEIGWHLFGEAYERGAFLVKMREKLRMHQVEESTELPDHLVHVLKLVGRLESEEQKAFVSHFLHPALKKMLDGFEGKSNPYEHLIRALSVGLSQDQLQGVGHHG